MHSFKGSIKKLWILFRAVADFQRINKKKPTHPIHGWCWVSELRIKKRVSGLDKKHTRADCCWCSVLKVDAELGVGGGHLNERLLDAERGQAHVAVLVPALAHDARQSAQHLKGKKKKTSNCEIAAGLRSRSRRNRGGPLMNDTGTKRTVTPIFPREKKRIFKCRLEPNSTSAPGFWSFAAGAGGEKN